MSFRVSNEQNQSTLSYFLQQVLETCSFYVLRDYVRFLVSKEGIHPNYKLTRVDHRDFILSDMQQKSMVSYSSIQSVEGQLH